VKLLEERFGKAVVLSDVDGQLEVTPEGVAAPRALMKLSEAEFGRQVLATWRRSKTDRA
jgi:hypothetical protein